MVYFVKSEFVSHIFLSYLLGSYFSRFLVPPPLLSASLWGSTCLGLRHVMEPSLGPLEKWAMREGPHSSLLSRPVIPHSAEDVYRVRTKPPRHSSCKASGGSLSFSRFFHIDSWRTFRQPLEAVFRSLAAGRLFYTQD